MADVHLDHNLDDMYPSSTSTFQDHTTSQIRAQDPPSIMDISRSRNPSPGSQIQPRKIAATVPCQYRTGKTLGSGTYAIVKEAVHIKTGKYYVCKVINKKLMEGREYMVRNEIAVLKRLSSGHNNIVTLHDYFETSNNLYLVFDLCSGGELFDRICAKGNYHEPGAAELVRTIMKAGQYVHDSGIVHRDLKPENLLFRTSAEDADVMISDFSLSRVMEEEKFHLLTGNRGTPGYMASEIFKKTGHGKPVDIWATEVTTHFLLAGYTPFDRENQQREMQAIIVGDSRFDPEEYWANVSDALQSEYPFPPFAQESQSHFHRTNPPQYNPDPYLVYSFVNKSPPEHTSLTIQSQLSAILNRLPSLALIDTSSISNAESPPSTQAAPDPPAIELRISTPPTAYLPTHHHQGFPQCSPPPLPVHPTVQSLANDYTSVPHGTPSWVRTTPTQPSPSARKWRDWSNIIATVTLILTLISTIAAILSLQGTKLH